MQYRIVFETQYCMRYKHGTACNTKTHAHSTQTNTHAHSSSACKSKTHAHSTLRAQPHHQQHTYTHTAPAGCLEEKQCLTSVTADLATVTAQTSLPVVGSHGDKSLPGVSQAAGHSWILTHRNARQLLCRSSQLDPVTQERQPAALPLFTIGS